MTGEEILDAVGISPGVDLRNVRLRREWGKAIELQRKAIGMTRRQLAEAVGVSTQAVQQWENGNTAPRPHLQVEIARTLNISWAVLFKVAA